MKVGGSCGRTTRLAVALLLAATAVVAIPAPAPASPGPTAVVSMASDGTAGNGVSRNPDISADGSVVAFESLGSNLVTGDNNGVSDVFVHDRATGATARVSVARDGSEGNGESRSAALSANGRYVAFESTASNLVVGDVNGVSDVFVHDRETGATTRVSVGAGGVGLAGPSHSPAISGDGSYVVFTLTDPLSGRRIYFHDRQSGASEVVSAGGDAVSGLPPPMSAVSDDGRLITFSSSASDLVEADTNAASDVFVRDRTSGATARVSVASDASQASGPSVLAAMTPDGRHVAFTSSAPNLVEADTNGSNDGFVHDRSTARTTRATIASDGTEGDNGGVTSGISADGRYVASESSSPNLAPTSTGTGILVHDRHSGATTAEGEGEAPAISADGLHVAFHGAEQVMVHDRQIDPRIGFLRVTTSPPLPSQISVDGVPRATYGLINLRVTPGNHQVCFRDVEGYDTPPCQDVAVDEGVISVVEGAFVPRGFLQVVTSPALPAKISVDGVARDDWGLFTDLPVGPHQVCFGPVRDYAPPPCETVSLSADAPPTTVTGSYQLSLGAPGEPAGDGALRVTTNPSVPSQISVDGVARSTHGIINLQLAPGQHSVCFSDVEGYVTPQCEQVEVGAGATTSLEGSFAANGYLQGTTSPALPAVIYVDGVARDDWGVFTDLAVGPHQVCFGPVEGYVSPACQTANLLAGITSTADGSYVEG